MDSTRSREGTRMWRRSSLQGPETKKVAFGYSLDWHQRSGQAGQRGNITSVMDAALSDPLLNVTHNAGLLVSTTVTSVATQSFTSMKFRA